VSGCLESPVRFILNHWQNRQSIKSFLTWTVSLLTNLQFVFAFTTCSFWQETKCCHLLWCLTLFGPFEQREGVKKMLETWLSETKQGHWTEEQLDNKHLHSFHFLICLLLHAALKALLAMLLLVVRKGPWALDRNSCQVSVVDNPLC